MQLAIFFDLVQKCLLLVLLGLDKVVMIFDYDDDNLGTTKYFCPEYRDVFLFDTHLS